MRSSAISPIPLPGSGSRVIPEREVGVDEVQPLASPVHHQVRGVGGRRELLERRGGLILDERFGQLPDNLPRRVLVRARIVGPADVRAVVQPRLGGRRPKIGYRRQDRVPRTPHLTGGRGAVDGQQQRRRPGNDVVVPDEHGVDQPQPSSAADHCCRGARERRAGRAEEIERPSSGTETVRVRPGRGRPFRGTREHAADRGLSSALDLAVPVSTDPTGSAVIVPASADFSRDAVEALCCDQLASYKRPRHYMVRDEPLPRNANAKILKRELRPWLVAELEIGSGDAAPCDGASAELWTDVGRGAAGHAHRHEPAQFGVVGTSGRRTEMHAKVSVRPDEE
ncbi:hypothetical protein H7X46_11945 [Pseudonocardia sp. C8]|nr:hypothetical protein [Pseudonocardia sp. C8]MBC3191774.1 hypothetical protein [Pseudonocardia sp. C8]